MCAFTATPLVSVMVVHGIVHYGIIHHLVKKCISYFYFKTMVELMTAFYGASVQVKAPPEDL